MTLYNYIRRRSYDDVAFTKFDQNLKFIPDDILLNIVTCLGSHRNYSSCRMDFIHDGITNSLMKQ
jgi:hypothetical protein